MISGLMNIRFCTLPNLFPFSLIYFCSPLRYFPFEPWFAPSYAFPYSNSTILLLQSGVECYVPSLDNIKQVWVGEGTPHISTNDFETNYLLFYTTHPANVHFLRIQIYCA
jgi:hypothetical protein